MKKIRQLDGRSVVDPSTIENLMYNNPSGARKSVQVGPHLLPIPTVSGFTTTPTTTAVALPRPGKNIAVYNNSNAVHAITFGNDSTVTAQSAGAVDANGNAGIPCAPNAWTYLASATQGWVIADSSALMVFVIDDDTYAQIESTQDNAST